MKTKQIVILFLVGVVCFLAGFFVREKLISKTNLAPLDSCEISIPEVEKQEILNNNSTTSDNIIDTDENASGENKEMIRLSNIREGQAISSPLVIEGEARGGWFFEGSFPVVLTDWDGLIIAEGVAQAQGDWMVDDFVDFRAELEFNKPDTIVSNRAALILKKDNPSGLPENDDALEITVFFK